MKKSETSCADESYAAGQRPSVRDFCVQTKSIVQARECKFLVDEISRGGLANGTVLAESEGVRRECSDPAQYVARQAYFDPTVPKFRWLFARAWPHIQAAAQRLGLEENELTLRECGRLVRYDVGGHFNWHPDCDGLVGRQLSVVVQLSRPPDYAGGDLLIMGEDGKWGCADRAQGAVCVFPARLHHRVMPITKGQRHSAIFWLY